MHGRQLVSFIIPTHARQELLEKCILSLNSALMELTPQDLRDFDFQIIVVFNGEEVRSFNQVLSINIHTIVIDRTRPAVARNRAIQLTDSDYYYFIDDDTCVPRDFLKKTCHIIRHYPAVEIFGGPDNCYTDANFLERSLELALRSPLTTQKTRRRHTPYLNKSPEKGHERNLILCNLCVKKNIFFDKQVYFPSDYQRNEENVFLSQLEGKVKILHFSDHYIYHQRRYTLSSVFHAASKSGFYRFKMMRDGFGDRQWIFVIPAVFVWYLLITLVSLSILGISVFAYPLVVYFVMNLVTSLKVVVASRSFLYLPWVMVYQFWIVSSYGIGMNMGILKSLKDFFRWKRR
jgi:glycosyltransferase involved in cell wall biosynthesis